MGTFEIISLTANFILSGGIIALATVRSAKRKANAEAVGAELDNVQHASEILVNNIVTPLKKELNGVRRELAKFRKAVEKVNACPYSADCPVVHELHNDEGAERNEE